MNAQSRPDSVPSPSAPLCPIPQNGIPGASGALLFCLLTLAAAMVGLTSFAFAEGGEPPLARYISIGVIVVLLFYLWRVTRSAKGFTPLLLIAGVVVYSLTSSFVFPTSSLVLPASLLGLLFVIGEGSFLLAVLPRKHIAWFPLIAILAYTIALFLSRDPFGSAAVLIPFPPMVALALGTRNSAAKEDGLTRVGVICATSLTFGLTLTAATALSLYRELGTLAPGALMEFLESFREALIEALCATEIPEGFDPEMVEQFQKMLSYSNVSNLVNSIFNLFPAIFVVFVNLISAAAQMLQHANLRTFKMEESITDRVRAFRMSLISCIVFLIAYLMVFLDSSEMSSLSGTVAQNVYVILLPGLALAGMLRIMNALVKKGPRGLGCLFYLAIIIPCLLLISPFILAAVEVIGHIFGSVIKALSSPDDSDPFSKS